MISPPRREEQLEQSCHEVGPEPSSAVAFVDLETTGTSPASDRVVEIAILKVHLGGTEDFRCNRVNPGVSIPERPPQFTESMMRMLLISRRLRPTRVV
jgi:DNA polymerase III epsilon subunit-like protein